MEVLIRETSNSLATYSNGLLPLINNYVSLTTGYLSSRGVKGRMLLEATLTCVSDAMELSSEGSHLPLISFPHIDGDGILRIDKHLERLFLSSIVTPSLSQTSLKVLARQHRFVEIWRLDDAHSSLRIRTSNKFSFNIIGTLAYASTLATRLIH